MDFYKSNIPVIDADAPDAKGRDMLHPRKAGFGLVPRDWYLYPEGMFAPPAEMATVPESEWDARFDEQEEQESSLEHIFLRGGRPAFVNLDQNGDGHCWQYSVGTSIMLDRLKRGLKVVRLNPHAGAAIQGRLNGGWCGLGAQFARTVGLPPEGTGPGQWPLHSNNTRYDTPQMRAEAAKYRITEDWVDLTRPVYSQNLTRLQVATCGFNNIPAPSDFNWWAHSVCQVRWVRVERGSWGPLILNSWKGWGRHGLAVLRGSQAVCNGGVATRLTGAAS